MTLPPGTRLGPYEISAQIGVGGMGEVYKATDTKLKRQVAIKVLPASVAADAERLARFQREAEVEHLHCAVGTHLDVGGLEIPVDDPLLVRRFERLGDLFRDGERLVDREA